ncbi:MAG: hypothetical protein KY469_13450 [Actinobacteria bacterium]|nr:hypothetical protein [Actinomycetota bacterium]
MPRLTRSALAVAALLVLAGCGDDDTDVNVTPDTDTTTEAQPTETAAPPDTAEPTEAAAPTDATGAVTLATASSDLGTILIDGEGRTLYVFDNDTDGTSTCYDQCAENWPAFTGTAEAGGDVDASLIGTTTRDDGTTQVTYNGQPLYYFAADQAPGDTNGQGVGDVWWVVGPDGAKIT